MNENERPEALHVADFHAVAAEQISAPIIPPTDGNSAAPAVDLEALNAVPEHGGNIQALIERYGDNPQKCPVIRSMGDAGIQLVQRLAAAEKDPDRGPTMRELLEARKQQAKTSDTPNTKLAPKKAESQSVESVTEPDADEPETKQVGWGPSYGSLLVQGRISPNIKNVRDDPKEQEDAQKLKHTRLKRKATKPKKRPLVTIQDTVETTKKSPTTADIAPGSVASFVLPAATGTTTHTRHESDTAAPTENTQPVGVSLQQEAVVETSSNATVPVPSPVATERKVAAQTTTKETPADAPARVQQTHETPAETESERIEHPLEAPELQLLASDAIETDTTHDNVSVAQASETALDGDTAIQAEIANGDALDSAEIVRTEIPDAPAEFADSLVSVEQPAEPAVQTIEQELTIYIESLDAEQDEKAHAAVAEFIVALHDIQDAKDDSGFDAEGTHESAQIEQLLTQVFKSLQIDPSPEMITHILQSINKTEQHTPELPTEQSNLSNNQKNNLGTHEYLSYSAIATFKRLLQNIKLAITAKLLLGRYALQATMAT